MAPTTVRAIARQYEEEDLEAALYEKPRPGKQRVLDAGQSQRIIAEEAVERKLAPKVGRETIRILLPSHDLKPWREKRLVRGAIGRGVHPAHEKRAGLVWKAVVGKRTHGLYR